MYQEDRNTHVGVLINGARDQTRHRVVLAKDLRERVGERRSGLDSDKVVLSDVITVRP